MKKLLSKALITFSILAASLLFVACQNEEPAKLDPSVSSADVPDLDEDDKDAVMEETSDDVK